MFIEKVGEAQINVIVIAEKHDLARVFRKLLKELGVALQSCSDLETQDFETETNKLLTQQLSDKEAMGKEFKGYLVRYAT